MNRAGLLTDWRLLFGTQLGRSTCILLCGVAFLAVAISALSLIRGNHRGRHTRTVFVLRALAVATCLAVALQPRLEFGKVSVVPNHVAILVDASRSMTVALPDHGKTRSQRATDLVASAAPLFAQWEQRGHQVEFYTFGEVLASTSLAALPNPPKADATRIGEALSELRGRFAGRDLGAVVLVSDGIDTGRIGHGPLDSDTRKTLEALGAPVHTVFLGEKELRDLSVAAVLADDFAFVRTPVKLEAVLRQSGLGGRMVEVSLLLEGRLIDAKAVRLRSDSDHEKVTFEFTPDHPGNFVFEIKTPVLAGEALDTNNSQVFTLKVIRDRVRVLHVCGRPSWNERFLRSILRLDPNVDLVSFFILRTDTDEMAAGHDEMSLIPFPYKEIFDEQLKSFDLLIFDNFNFKPYSVEPYLPGVRAYIEGGGALAMLGGDLSFASGLYGESALRDVLPVELIGIPADKSSSYTTDTFRPRLTPEGRTHPVTALTLDEDSNEARWAALPPLVGINRVSGLRPGASALLLHPTQKSADGRPAPVLATADIGKGRTLALLTDTAWQWGFQAAGAGDDGRAFQRFWESAIRWLVRDPALTLLHVDLDKVEYRRGQTVMARVRTLRADYTPSAGVDVALELQPAGSLGNPAPLRTLKVTTNSEGEGHFELAGLDPGAYRLLGRANLNGRATEEQTTFVLRSEGHELDDVIAREDVLREIAEASGGEFHRGAMGNPELRSGRKVRIGSLRTIEIWSNPALLLLALALLATEWTLRRRIGQA